MLLEYTYQTYCMLTSPKPTPCESTLDKVLNRETKCRQHRWGLRWVVEVGDGSDCGGDEDDEMTIYLL